MSKDVPIAAPATDPTDAAFARLTAADPALVADPATNSIPKLRLGVLRAKVDALVAAEPSLPAPQAAAGLPDELAAARAAKALRSGRLRRVPVWAAGSVAAALLLGVGFAAGTLANPGGPGLGGANNAPLAAAGFAEAGRADALIDASGATVTDEAGSRVAAGPTAPMPVPMPAPAGGGLGGGAIAESASADMGRSLPWFSGRMVFSASGLSETGGWAPGYALDPAGIATAELAAQLAEYFGVPGEVRSEWGSWNVGAPDWSGPQLQLALDGLASFSFSNWELDPWTCAVSPDGNFECPTPPATSVDDATAIATLAEAMRAFNVDPAEFEVAVEPLSEDNNAARWVTARRIIGGTLTDSAWAASITDQGVVWLNGTLAPVVDLGEFEVISPTEAVRRLADPRFDGPGFVSSGPIAIAVAESRVPEIQIEPPTAPLAPAPGQLISWPVENVTITSARLGLAQHWTPSGAVMFLPAYELSDATGNIWSIIAVAESGLDFANN